MKYTLYYREVGPICFEVELYPKNESDERFLNQILSAPIAWFWESERRYPVLDSAGGGRPSVRAVTALTQSTLKELQHDIMERDIDGYGRFIALYGVDPSIYVGPRGRDCLNGMLNDFVNCERGPLWIIVIQVGDSIQEHVFVTHLPPKPIEELLDAWGLKDTRTRKVRKYGWLGVIALEGLGLLSDSNRKGS